MKGLQEAESAAANVAILTFGNRAPYRLPGEVLKTVRQAHADYLITSRERVTVFKEVIAEINQTYFAQEDAEKYSDRLPTATAITSANLHREQMKNCC